MSTQKPQRPPTIAEVAANRTLSPGYKPAEADSRIFIGFMGNMAIISTLAMENVDPFQLLAASEYLKMKGLQFLQAHELAEAEEKRRRVATTKQTGILTPGEFARQTGRWANPQDLKEK